MTLSLYNTKTKSVEIFTPITPGVATMYACGPTVYDYTHIGHMRKYIGDDILRRTLSYLGYEVKHVMNITDVGHLTNDSDEGDDKFEGKAAQEGKSVQAIAELYTDYFHESMQAVNVLPPNIAEAKATDHIAEMISLVEKLITRGHAYETQAGIYFDTQTFAAYGSLSGQKLEQKETGVRDDVVVDADKKHPADFVLWFKRVGRFAEHIQYWSSPWGDGFPGWHIECSAMSMHYLGETIDIHTGGIDHIPVHHENEIAQSECATGHDFVHVWVHHAFLNVDGEKMSKSKHNFYTISDIEGHNIDPRAMRLLCMGTSYRKPLNFTWDALSSCAVQLKRLDSFASIKETGGVVLDDYRAQFTQAMSDDMNGAKALAVVWEMLGNTSLARNDQFATLISFDAILGLGLADVAAFTVTEEARVLLEKMLRAREAKDYAASDTLRDELASLGYTVEQRPDGASLSPL